MEGMCEAALHLSEHLHKDLMQGMWLDEGLGTFNAYFTIQNYILHTKCCVFAMYHPDPAPTQDHFTCVKQCSKWWPHKYCLYVWQYCFYEHYTAVQQANSYSLLLEKVSKRFIAVASRIGHRAVRPATCVLTNCLCSTSVEHQLKVLDWLSTESRDGSNHWHVIKPCKGGYHLNHIKGVEGASGLMLWSVS